MPRMAGPSFASRTNPTKLATAPTSFRPPVNASSSRPTSKSSACTRTIAIAAPGDGREESHFVAHLERRREIRHLLVHRHAPGLAGREGIRPGRVAGTQVLDQRGDRARGGQRHELARATEALPEAGEVEKRHHERPSGVSAPGARG